MGRPVVLRDGVAVAAPRGAKPWALLAYLVASQRAHTRSELAALLFSEAADPLGALRWNLAAVRRLLRLPEVLKGGALTLELPRDAIVDVRLLGSGDPSAVELPGIGEDLLAGLAFPGSAAFEAWLLTERRQLARRAASLLRKAALASIGRGDYDRARQYAIRLVTADALDEGHQALLIRTHALAGDAAAAREQYQRCRRLLRKELGVEPGPAVLAAAHTVPDVPSADATVPTRSNVTARSIVAWQSFLAGAVDHGINLGRQAVSLADHADAPDLRLTVRLHVGAMLGMTARGWDEACTLLSEAEHLAQRVDAPLSRAYAHGLLAGNTMMRADYEAAIEHAQAGLALSEDSGARSQNLAFLGAIEADCGRFEVAIEHVRSAVDAAKVDKDLVRLTWTAAHAGRVLMMADHIAEAEKVVEIALDAAKSPTTRPWPLALLAEIKVFQGELTVARKLAQEAGSTAFTTQIPWQRALGLRAAALAAAAAGEMEAATRGLIEALRQARHAAGEGYAFHWPIAFTLDSLSRVTATQDPVESRRWAKQLHAYASALGMHAYEVRAQRYLSLDPKGGLH